MLGQSGEFYHSLTKKYTAIFGTLFNDIWISRYDESATKVEDFKVVLGYGPREKMLGRVIEDPTIARDRAIILPRMSYELTSMNYDSVRALNPSGKLRVNNPDNSSYTVLNPVPWNLNFTLYIAAKSIEDGLKIVEQIVPYFRPDLSVTAHLLDVLPEYNKDLSIVLNSVIHEDTYEGPIENTRALVWTLDFTLKGYFYTGIPTAKVIKFVTANIYSSANNITDPYTRIEVYPGLTANGEPTTDPSETIPYQQINEKDNWDYIVITDDIIDSD